MLDNHYQVPSIRMKFRGMAAKNVFHYTIRKNAVQSLSSKRKYVCRCALHSSAQLKLAGEHKQYTFNCAVTGTTYLQIVETLILLFDCVLQSSTPTTYPSPYFLSYTRCSCRAGCSLSCTILCNN